MEIRAKVALSLPNDFYKIILKYDTFEKATYDSYLVASIVKITKTEKEAFKYIDEITGNGSLNPHFKKMYKEISQLSDEQVQNILNDSLFPITIVDKKNHKTKSKLHNKNNYHNELNKAKPPKVINRYNSIQYIGNTYKDISINDQQNNDQRTHSYSNSRKNKVLETTRSIREQEELSECTFHPSVNKTYKRNWNGVPDNVHTRLYTQHKLIQDPNFEINPFD